MTTPKIGLISGSTRTGSINQALIKAMALEFEDQGAKAEIINLADYDMPIYNGDWEAENGVPKAAKALIETINSCDGIFIATPEYNGCLPALLKNSIDWTTRVGRDHFKGPVYAIGAATPGGQAGMMVLKQLQFILAKLGASVIPQQLGVGFAGQAFDENGWLNPGRPKNFADALIAQMMTEIKRRQT